MTGPDDEITVRLPRWAWTEIVEVIERWTGRNLGDIQILDVAAHEADCSGWHALPWDGGDFPNLEFRIEDCDCWKKGTP